MGKFPFNLDELINRRNVESFRIEYKSGWNENSKEQLIRTVCAFANDFYNQNGGYIILGIEEGEDGRPILPPKGLAEMNLDTILPYLGGGKW